MPAPIIPSSSFFPLGLLDRVGWYANFNTHAQAEGLNYGLVQADLDQIKDDNGAMQFIGTSYVALDAYSQGWTAFRNILMTGTIGEPTPDMPTTPSLSLSTIPPTGIFQRINKYRDIVRASLNYTKEVGETWGIEPSTPDPINPTLVQPVLKTFPAATGYHFSAVVSKREQADSFQVWVYRKGGSNWELAATATGKSIDVTIVPQSPGDPEQIQVRIQLLKGNAPYGQPSDTIWVTLNP